MKGKRVLQREEYKRLLRDPSAWKVPSPQEVEQAQTRPGGWTAITLAGWGVMWPPPRGWRDELRRRWHAGEPATLITHDVLRVQEGEKTCPNSLSFVNSDDSCPFCGAAKPKPGDPGRDGDD